MKTLIALLLTISVSAFAQTAPPATLARTMKAMSADLKAVTAQATDVSQNASSAALADDFVQLTLHAKDFVPDSIAALPADQQAGAKAQYDKMLDQAAALGTQLAAAFRANDNAQAAVILNQLVQTKRDGHDQFNP